MLKKLEIELPYEPAIPLLGIHTEETRIERDTCTPMFITALFIIARTWKQPRCPSADEWIRKLWYIYTMEYYSAIKKNILGGSKITADSNCSHEIKRCLLLGRKIMSNLDSIFKSRDLTLPTKVRLVKAMVFPVVMYGCESWTVRRLNAEELMLLNCGVGEDS